MTSTIETSVVKIADVQVAEGFNPREDFDETALEQLAASIKSNGITTAITVRREDDHYVVVDGERRLRAAKKAGLSEIPVLVRDDDGALAAALVANVQREDLNPIEEAKTLKRLTEIEGLATHKALAEQVGRPTRYVSERLKLLALPEGCHKGIASGEIPLSAEPSLRAIAKAEPRLAEAACAAVLAADHEASDLVDQLGNVLHSLVVAEDGPFICEISGGATIEELVSDTEKAHELAERVAVGHENDGPYSGSRYLRLQEGDFDRLRASGKLIEIEGDHEWARPMVFLADSELAADLAVELVERAEKATQDTAKEAAKRAGVEIDAGAEGSSVEQLRDAQSETRRKEREKVKKEADRAEAFNAELGVALLKRRGAQSRKAHRLNRAKALAERVITDNRQLAGAGLRLVLPQLRDTETTTLKNGAERVKVSHRDSAQCSEYLSGAIERAKSVDEVLELMAEAFIAATVTDERELPRSRRISWWPGVGNDPAKLFAEEIKEVKPKQRKRS